MSGEPSARVPLLGAEEAAEAASGVGVLPQLAELNVFRVLLRRPHVAKATADLLLALLGRTALDARLRELAIMRIGWRTGSEYEWTQHWRIATQLGVTEEDLLATRRVPLGTTLGPLEQAVLAAADETLETGLVSQMTFAECRAAMGQDATIELVISIGAWLMLSTLLRSFAVPVEGGVAPWPPDGQQPSGQGGREVHTQ